MGNWQLSTLGLKSLLLTRQTHLNSWNTLTIKESVLSPRDFLLEIETENAIHWDISIDYLDASTLRR